LSLCDRIIEYVDHLHSHFVDPVVVRDGCYQVPQVDILSLPQHCVSINRLRKLSAMPIALSRNSSQSYRGLPAIWDHAVLLATRHRWTHRALTSAKQTSTRFTQRDGSLSWQYTSFVHQ